ncbi:hypothetical protein VTK56DRAFT_5992 [Thermocarpiscus australiensis]
MLRTCGGNSWQESGSFRAPLSERVVLPGSHCQLSSELTATGARVIWTVHVDPMGLSMTEEDTIRIRRKDALAPS